MANKKKAPKGTVKKVLSFIGVYKFRILLSLICAAISVGATLYIPLLFGNALDVIKENGDFSLEAIAKILIESFIWIALCGVVTWIMNAVNNKITFYVSRDIRNSAFAKINILPLKYLDSHPTGDTLSRVITDVDQFSEGLLMGFTQLFTGLLTILGTLGILFFLNFKIALVVLLLTPVSLFVARFIANHTFEFFKAQSQIRGKQTAVIDETLGNLKTVKAFSKEDDRQAEFDETNNALQKASLNAIFYSSITNPATRFVNSLVYAATALVGAISVFTTGGTLTVGLLTSVLSYANQYTKPFNEISSVAAELQNSLACAARVLELIEERTEPEDKPDAVTLNTANGDMEFSRVCFSYDKDKKLIEDFNLSVKKGQRVAIVGPTGCGKTTLINLIMRFYDVDKGGISLDSTDIRDIKRHSLRSNIGMVLQETWIKGGTVLENINIGKPDATREEILEAAKKARAHSFIKRLPDGYDTVLSEDGEGLSQGQKQLLCITRVMLALPEILILDEATSSIDVRTEIRIQKAFNTLMENRTSFIVAHRLSTVMGADIILVMKDGRIIEQGNHNELMEKNGFYTELFNSQFAAV